MIQYGRPAIFTIIYTLMAQINNGFERKSNLFEKNTVTVLKNNIYNYLLKSQCLNNISLSNFTGLLAVHTYLSVLEIKSNASSV